MPLAKATEEREKEEKRWSMTEKKSSIWDEKGEDESDEMRLVAGKNR